MTVYVAHAPADREAAEALEKFLERRGQFVELDDGQTALRPVQQSDVVVLLVSPPPVSGSNNARSMHGPISGSWW
jgi:DNA-binding response OmpR family regulator